MKGTPFAQFAFNSDRSLHQFAELLADGQPQTCASVFARKRRISLVKRLEKVSHLLRAHSNSGIGNRDIQTQIGGGDFFRFHPNRDLADLGELDCIVDQVD